MNHLARLFHSLSNAWQQDAGGEATEDLAVAFASEVARLVHQHKNPKLVLQAHRLERLEELHNLALFLKTYGLMLCTAPLRNKEACLLGVHLATRKDLANPELTGRVRAIRRAVAAVGSSAVPEVHRGAR